jgi:gamma-glutamyltranspeptidase/glutathione hydrolase
MLHNRGYGFRFEEGHPNAIAPGKRPMHTIIPGMAMQGGRAVMPFGVMGGHYQPMGQSWLLASHFEHGLELQAAVDLPRMLPRLGALQVERGIPAATLSRLAGLGHRIQLVDKPHGGAQAIRIDHARGVLIGASDPRKDGCAIGY